MFLKHPLFLSRPIDHLIDFQVPEATNYNVILSKNKIGHKLDTLRFHENYYSLRLNLIRMQ